MKLVYSVWVPHLLTWEQIGLSLCLAEENLKKLSDLDDRYRDRVITADELQIHHYDPKLGAKTSESLAGEISEEITFVGIFWL